MKIYPEPDFASFAKATAVLGGFLVFLHWLPDLVTWLYSNFFDEKLVWNARGYRHLLYVAYAMVGVAMAAQVLGLLWATWHLPRRKAYEASRKQRMDAEIAVETSAGSDDRASPGPR